MNPVISNHLNTILPLNELLKKEHEYPISAIEPSKENLLSPVFTCTPADKFRKKYLESPPNLSPAEKLPPLNGENLKRIKDFLIEEVEVKGKDEIYPLNIKFTHYELFQFLIDHNRRKGLPAPSFKLVGSDPAYRINSDYFEKTSLEKFGFAGTTNIRPPHDVDIRIYGIGNLLHLLLDFFAEKLDKSAIDPEECSKHLHAIAKKKKRPPIYQQIYPKHPKLYHILIKEKGLTSFFFDSSKENNISIIGYGNRINSNYELIGVTTIARENVNHTEFHIPLDPFFNKEQLISLQPICPNVEQFLYCHQAMIYKPVDPERITDKDFQTLCIEMVRTGIRCDNQETLEIILKAFLVSELKGKERHNAINKHLKNLFNHTLKHEKIPVIFNLILAFYKTKILSDEEKKYFIHELTKVETDLTYETSPFYFTFFKQLKADAIENFIHWCVITGYMAALQTREEKLNEHQQFIFSHHAGPALRYFSKIENKTFFSYMPLDIKTSLNKIFSSSFSPQCAEELLKLFHYLLPKQVVAFEQESLISHAEHKTINIFGKKFIGHPKPLFKELGFYLLLISYSHEPSQELFETLFNNFPVIYQLTSSKDRLINEFKTIFRYSHNIFNADQKILEMYQQSTLNIPDIERNYYNLWVMALLEAESPDLIKLAIEMWKKSAGKDKLEAKKIVAKIFYSFTDHALSFLSYLNNSKVLTPTEVFSELGNRISDYPIGKNPVLDVNLTSLLISLLEKNPKLLKGKTNSPYLTPLFVMAKKLIENRAHEIGTKLLDTVIQLNPSKNEEFFELKLLICNQQIKASPECYKKILELWDKTKFSLSLYPKLSESFFKFSFNVLEQQLVYKDLNCFDQILKLIKLNGEPSFICQYIEKMFALLPNEFEFRRIPIKDLIECKNFYIKHKINNQEFIKVYIKIISEIESDTFERLEEVRTYLNEIRANFSESEINKLTASLSGSVANLLHSKIFTQAFELFKNFDKSEHFEDLLIDLFAESLNRGDQEAFRYIFNYIKNSNNLLDNFNIKKIISEFLQKGLDQQLHPNREFFLEIFALFPSRVKKDWDFVYELLKPTKAETKKAFFDLALFDSIPHQTWIPSPEQWTNLLINNFLNLKDKKNELIKSISSWKESIFSLGPVHSLNIYKFIFQHLIKYIDINNPQDEATELFFKLRDDAQEFLNDPKYFDLLQEMDIPWLNKFFETDNVHILKSCLIFYFATFITLQKNPSLKSKLSEEHSSLILKLVKFTENARGDSELKNYLSFIFDNIEHLKFNNEIVQIINEFIAKREYLCAIAILKILLINKYKISPNQFKDTLFRIINTNDFEIHQFLILETLESAIANCNATLYKGIASVVERFFTRKVELSLKNAGESSLNDVITLYFKNPFVFSFPQAKKILVNFVEISLKNPSINFNFILFYFKFIYEKNDKELKSYIYELAFKIIKTCINKESASFQERLQLLNLYESFMAREFELTDDSDKIQQIIKDFSNLITPNEVGFYNIFLKSFDKYLKFTIENHYLKIDMDFDLLMSLIVFKELNFNVNDDLKSKIFKTKKTKALFFKVFNKLTEFKTPYGLMRASILYTNFLDLNKKNAFQLLDQASIKHCYHILLENWKRQPFYRLKECCLYDYIVESCFSLQNLGNSSFRHSIANEFFQSLKEVEQSLNPNASNYQNEKAILGNFYKATITYFKEIMEPEWIVEQSLKYEKDFDINSEMPTDNELPSLFILSEQENQIYANTLSLKQTFGEFIDMDLGY